MMDWPVDEIDAPRLRIFAENWRLGRYRRAAWLLGRSRSTATVRAGLELLGQGLTVESPEAQAAEYELRRRLAELEQND